MHRALAYPLIGLALSACGASPKTPKTASSGSTPASSTVQAPAAPAPEASARRVFGVRYQVPTGWDYREEGEFAIGRSPTGDAAFVVAGVDDSSRLPAALHVAEHELGARPSVSVGSGNAAQLGRQRFLLTTELRDLGMRKARVSTLVGTGPKTKFLIVFTLNTDPTASDASKRNEALLAWASSFDIDDAAPAPALDASGASTTPIESSQNLPRAEVPVPLSEAEKRELKGACKPVVAAFEKHVAASKVVGRLPMVLEGMTRTLASPPPGATKPCLSLFERDARGYVIATLGAEAKVQLRTLASAMNQTFAETGKLCPSSTRPVPTKIPEFYAKVSSYDWRDPTWSCLHMDGVVDRTSVQVEVMSRADGATFVARGIPFPTEGTVVEWRLEARLKDGRLTQDEPAIAP